MTDFFQAFGINKRRVWKEETRKTKRPGVERATSGLQLKRRARICTESLEARLRYHLGGSRAPPTLTSGVNKAARCTFTSFILRIVLHEPYRRSPVWLRPERSESLSSCFLPDWKAHFELELILLATDRKPPQTRWVAATPLVDRLRALQADGALAVVKGRAWNLYIYTFLCFIQPPLNHDCLMNSSGKLKIKNTD